ncbi:NADH-quinone oxidoreductase subunit M, partial [Methanosalsum natronophilum]
MIPIISLMILIALIGAIVTIFTKTKEHARIIALVTSVVTLVGSLYMFFNFDSQSAALQFVDTFEWIPSIGVSYTVAVDGISMPLVLLTSIVIPLIVLYSWNESKNPGKFYGMILATYAGVIGVFTAMDFFLFYVFWELSIIPMFFMINMWGGPEKAYASIKFLLYTHVASLVMLLGIFGLFFGAYFQAGITTFDIPTLLSQYQLFESELARTMIFIALLIGFIVKMPAVPFHSWLPHAYVQAPTAGTILMAAIMSKMGAYALFRFILPMLPFSGSADLMITVLAALGVLSIIYGAFLALAQDDIKRMIAFSSVSHMGFVTLGAVALIPLSVSGAMFQMFSHGIITCLMFMAIGAIQTSTGTRLISELGGLAQKMPKLAFLMVAGFMAYL